MTDLTKHEYPVKGQPSIVYTGDVGWFMTIVGGYPKGHDIPFHPSTHSGRMLRTILDRIGRDPVIIDLWKNAEEEKEGKLPDNMASMIGSCMDVGGRIVCLGKHVYSVVSYAFDGMSAIEYAPHPASRNPKSLETLEKILASYPRRWCLQPICPRRY